MTSLSDTFRKAEERYERQDTRYETLSNTAAGKDQIPLKSHYWTVILCMVPTIVMALGVVMGVLYITKQDLKASLSEIKINQGVTQKKIDNAAQTAEDVRERLEQKENGGGK